MRKLKPGTQKAIELRELGERSTEETAEVMCLSVAAVKARVFHGRKRLARALKGYAGSAWVSRKEAFRETRQLGR
jgi:DNA-directed RNA polymerase specialized sigma24 family protein